MSINALCFFLGIVEPVIRLCVLTLNWLLITYC